MNAVQRVWRILVHFVRGAQLDRELDEEMSQHFEMRVQEQLESGLTPDAARAAVARRFGGTLQAREASDDVWGVTWLHDFSSDLRYGVRMLRRYPGFSLVAVLSLGLGIGANTAVFSLLDAVVFRPLPVPAPHELVLFGESASIGVFFGVENGERSLFSHAEYRDLRDSQRTLRGILAVSEAPDESNIRVGGLSGSVEQAVGTCVSGNYFDVLGLTARVGRTLTSADDQTPGTHPVAVISDTYWARRFSRDPGVLGQTIHVGRAALVVVGVAPAGFDGDHVGRRSDFWIPLAMQTEVMPHRAWRDDPKALWLRIMGRVKPGQLPAQAAAELNVTWRQILTAKAGSLASAEDRRRLLDQRIALSSAATGVSEVREDYAGSLRTIMAMVMLVLLVACTNLATLMLARASARQKELGMRLALGAGRARVVRQLLAESLLLSVLGAGVGLAVARVCGELLLHLASDGPKPIPLTLPMDARVLGFTVGVTIITMLIVGLVPALRVSRFDPNLVLGPDAGRGPNGRARLAGRQVLVAAQVAVTLVLLVSAGLFVTTSRNLSRADLGFDRGVLQVNVDGIGAGYEGQRLFTLSRQLLERLGGIGGVTRVAVSDNGQLIGRDSMTQIRVSGDKARSDEEQYARFDQVSPGYFQTLSIPLLAGREFTEQDGPGAPLVAVINQTMARYYFGENNPIGRQFEERDDPRPFTVVGVVRDVKDLGPRRPVERRYYVSYFQAKEPPSVSLQLRLASTAVAVGPAVRAVIRDIDPSLEIMSMKTVDERLGRMIARDRLTARLAAAFGLLAVFLAAIGLYGVLAFAVARRTKEIGIRMALGARRSTVVSLVVRDGGLIVLAGVAIGLPAAWLAARAVASQLFGLSPADPMTIAVAVAVLVCVAALAAYLPARTASSVDPLRALRCE
jgi:predicted permease